MPKEVRESILTKYRVRYKGATRKGKSRILDEFCETWEYSRKHAIKLLNSPVGSKRKKTGPPIKYGPSVTRHLKVLWDLMDRPCSKRLKAAIPLWLEYYQDIECDTSIRSLLVEMSASTIDRLLRPFRVASKGISSTVPNKFLKSKIPMEILNGKAHRPGIVQADTVVHCGSSLVGSCAHSLTITDLFSGWTENRATWTKSAEAVLDQIRDIRTYLPFKVSHFSCDNGTEFINSPLVRYFEKNRDPGRPPIKFSRTRPYKKNDNCYVEQKNDSHVRRLFGYDRIDHPDLVVLMNDIYRNYWNPLQNYFLPNMKLVKKTRVGGRVKKVYDTPKTPYQRILECQTQSQLRKEAMKLHRDGLNPIQLQSILKEKLVLFSKALARSRALIAEASTESA